jgi:hypothetical protein
MGDMLDDVKMVKSSEHETVLKVGFMNDDRSNEEDYLNTFDIVIAGDGSLSHVNSLI